MSDHEDETIADRMVRERDAAQAAEMDAQREVFDLLEGGIDFVLGEAGALVVQGLRKAVGEPKPLQKLTAQRGTRHARFTAVSPTGGVECQVDLYVIGLPEKLDDPKKIQYVAEVKGNVEIPGRGLELFEDSYDPARLGHPTFSGPGIAQLIEMAIANILEP
jgi:hypothetical protein